jgi:hypothetical protein
MVLKTRHLSSSFVMRMGPRLECTQRARWLTALAAVTAIVVIRMHLKCPGTFFAAL